MAEATLEEKVSKKGLRKKRAEDGVKDSVDKKSAKPEAKRKGGAKGGEASPKGAAGWAKRTAAGGVKLGGALCLLLLRLTGVAIICLIPFIVFSIFVPFFGAVVCGSIGVAEESAFIDIFLGSVGPAIFSGIALGWVWTRIAKWSWRVIAKPGFARLVQAWRQS